MLDLMSHLLRLEAVIEEGSMRRAADRLNVTQPALSRSIAQLEAHFGRPLLERHSRGVVPTDFGRRVNAAIHRLARQWQLTEEELAAGDQLYGRLRIQAGPLWRVVVLPGLLVTLQRAFPEMVIELRNVTTDSAVRDLVEGRCDVVFGGVQIAEGRGKRLSVRPFTTVRDRVVAREDHPILADARPGELIDPLRVLDYPWVLYTADPAYEAATIHASVERLGAEPPVRTKCESLVAAISLLQRGDFLSILPDAAVASAAAPRIVPVPVNLSRRSVRSGAIFRSEAAEWPPLRKLLALCHGHFSPDAATEG